MLVPRVTSVVIGIVAANNGRNVIMRPVLVLFILILMVILMVVVQLVLMLIIMVLLLIGRLSVLLLLVMITVVVMVVVFILLLVVLLIFLVVKVVCAHVNPNKVVGFKNKCKYLFSCCFRLYDMDGMRMGD